MRIEKINVHRVQLPFLGEFSHALKTGPAARSSESIVVELLADRGKIRGFGEGAPRSYVTGETSESAAKSVIKLAGMASFPWDFEDVAQIGDFIGSLPEGRDRNAAICALEIALLDALGKNQGRHILEYMPNDFFAEKVIYGAAIPLSDRKKTFEICQKIKALGISSVKLKLGQNIEQNERAFETVHSVLGNGCEFKVDINSSWDLKSAISHVPMLKKFGDKVLEDPLIPEDKGIAELAAALDNSGVSLMADELACSFPEVVRIIEQGSYEMINVRLSKFGGFQRSLKIIEYLRNRGACFQIGAQLGESGVLSAAGRVLSLLCRDALYHEGSYDRFILKTNITSEDVTFGSGGRAGPLNGPGLGIDVDRANLLRLSHPEASLSAMRPQLA